MGQWSYSLADNDTVRDLLPEYRVAFHQYEPEKAIELLDQYAASLFKTDPEEMFKYQISLAVFLHKNGIDQRSAIQRAIKTIDTIIGQHDDKAETRIFVNNLIKVKNKLQQPLPKPKRIPLKLNVDPVFQVGDIITLEVYTDSIGQAVQYIMIQKIGDFISWCSQIDPSIKDHWPIFALFDHLGHKPGMRDFKHSARLCEFYSDGSISAYRKRHMEIIGHETVIKPADHCTKYLFFSQKPDQKILSLIKR